MKAIGDLFEYYGALTLRLIARILPYHLLQRLGKYIGLIVYYIFPVRKKIVKRNLDIAFPGLSNKQRKRMIRKTYINLVVTILEGLKIPYLGDRFFKDMIQAEGFEVLDELKKQGKGAILVGGHLGNWELNAVYIAHLGYPLSVIARPLHNSLTDALITKIRHVQGLEIIPVGIAVKKALKRLRENRFVGFVMDQDARKDGVFIEFFNKPASTAIGPATFAWQTDLPIVFCHAFRAYNGKHHLQVDQPIFMDKSRDRHDEILRVTRLYTKRLEEVIKEHPEQYFWFHNRYRTQKDFRREA